jgi:hypothetical protein
MLPVSDGVLQISEGFIKLVRMEGGGGDAGLVGHTAKTAASWYWTDIESYGYVGQVVWFVAGIGCSAAGVACFSSPDAEQAWETMSENVRRVGWGNTGLGKLQRNSNLSFGRWTDVLHREHMLHCEHVLH